MFPSKNSMEISNAILNNSLYLIKKFNNLIRNSIKKSENEITYFRALFSSLDYFFNNSLNIPQLNFRCQTKEIHQKPYVFINNRKYCELGDYFINVKYYHNGKLLGKKLIIYQFKREDNKEKWIINKKQLNLLYNWPEFTFGKINSKKNIFKLNPSTPEFGSFWLSERKANNGLLCHDYILDAINVKNLKIITLGRNHFGNTYYLPGSWALLFHLAWRLGEFIHNATILDDFVDTLYRYVGFAPDPPNEFNGFASDENSEMKFWGIEIAVKYEE